MPTLDRMIKEGTRRIVSKRALEMLRGQAQGVAPAVARRAAGLKGPAAAGLAAFFGNMSEVDPYEEEKLQRWKEQQRNQAPGSSPGVTEISAPRQAPGSSFGVEELSPEQTEAAAMEAGLEPQQQPGDVMRRQMLDLATQAGFQPTIDGNRLLLNGGEGGVVDLSNEDEVVQFADLAMSGVPEEVPQPRRLQMPPMEVQARAPRRIQMPPMEVQARAPRRIQMPPMAVQGRGAEEQAMDSMASRPMAKAKARMGLGRQQPRGLAGVDIEGVTDESPGAAKEKMSRMSAAFEELVDLGLDPQTLKPTRGADFSRASPRARWMARRMKVYKPTGKPARITGRKRR